MSSFREIREIGIVLFEEGVLTEDEFMLFYSYYHSVNPEFPYSNYSPFCLDELNEDECLAEFRVRKHDLNLLREVLQIPNEVKCPQRTPCPGLAALCILLNHLAYLCRYFDMIQRFGRPVPELCMISNQIIDLIFDIHGQRIMQWNPLVLSPDNLQIYAEAIHEKGAPLENCFGFIDGTIRPICRPGQHQRLIYHGHKTNSLVEISVRCITKRDHCAHIWSSW